jgi:hypothetical protein
VAVCTITLTVPEEVYAHIEALARMTTRSVDELAAQLLICSMSPLVKVDLPSLARTELGALDDLDNQALWAIVRSSANADKIALYDLLSERRSAGHITPEGQRLLEELSAEADALMLRVANAYALLRDRGQTVSTPA